MQGVVDSLPIITSEIIEVIIQECEASNMQSRGWNSCGTSFIPTFSVVVKEVNNFTSAGFLGETTLEVCIGFYLNRRMVDSWRRVIHRSHIICLLRSQTT